MVRRSASAPADIAPVNVEGPPVWLLVIGPFESEADAVAWRERHLPVGLPGGKVATAIGASGEETMEVAWEPVPDRPPPNPGGLAPA